MSVARPGDRRRPKQPCGPLFRLFHLGRPPLINSARYVQFQVERVFSAPPSRSNRTKWTATTNLLRSHLTTQSPGHHDAQDSQDGQDRQFLTASVEILSQGIRISSFGRSCCVDVTPTSCCGYHWRLKRRTEAVPAQWDAQR